MLQPCNNRSLPLATTPSESDSYTREQGEGERL